MGKETANRRAALIILALCLIISVILIAWWKVTGDKPVHSMMATVILSGISPATGDSPTDQAIARYTEMAKQNPQDDRAWTNLGNALLQKKRETEEARYYSQAGLVFQKALSLNSENVSAIIGMARVYDGNHEFDQSIEWANKAISIDPENQDAHGLLGDAAIEMGDCSAALEHYQKMLDIRPDLSSYSRTAHLLYLTGDTRKAIWLMQKAIKAGSAYPENISWCRAKLAIMLWGNGAILPAEQVLQTALEQTPNNYHVLAAMGKIKTARRDYGAAIDYYKKAMAITPRYDIAISLGDLYTITDQKEEAEKLYDLVEELSESNETGHIHGGAYHSHSNIQHSHGNIQMARFYADHDRNLSKALEEAQVAYQTDKNVFVIDTLAWCYYKNGHYEEARKIIEEALDFQVPDANILFHAGMIYSKLGDRHAAQKYLYQALSLNPSFHPVYADVAADTIKQLAANMTFREIRTEKKEGL